MPLVLGWLLFALSTVSPIRDSHEGWYDNWLYNSLDLAAAVLVLTRALRYAQERFAWLAMGVALALHAAGDVVFTSSVDPKSEVSVADGLLLGMYPLAMLGIVLLLRQSRLHRPVTLWLDATIAALALPAAAAALVFAPIEDAATGSPTLIAVKLAYPVADLLLLAVTAFSLMALGVSAGRRWWQLMGAFALLGVADVAYLLQSTRGAYHEGTLVDALWPAATLLIGFTAWHPRAVHCPGPARQLRGAVPVAVFALLSIGVLDAAVSADVHPVACVLASGCLVLCVLRLALSLRQSERLVGSHQLARTDELTGLGNRRAAFDTLDQLVSGSSTAALLILDLDRFKEVNDSFGHHAGDELLRQVAARLIASARQDDTVVRLGGDEFAVLVRGNAMNAGSVSTRITAALSAPFSLEGMLVHIGCSIGVAMYPAHADTAVNLLRSADLAMYEAKRQRTGLEIYSSTAHTKARRTLVDTEELREALALGRLDVHYQPKVRLVGGGVEALEALVRWPHATRGLQYPKDFLPLAQNAGLMPAVTDFVVSHVLSRMAQPDFPPGVRVDVNFPVTAIADGTFPSTLGLMLARYEVSPALFGIEITEEALLLDTVRVQDVLSELRELGVTISLDDYGSGYSSLAHLSDLPVDELKLDARFVAHLADDARAAAIVESTVLLAHSLGMTILAEGVDSEANAHELRVLGCDFAQGHWFCRAVPYPELQHWLRSRVPS